MIHDGRMIYVDYLRMDKIAFLYITTMLCERQLLRESIYVTVEEQLPMFLHTVEHTLYVELGDENPIHLL